MNTKKEYNIMDTARVKLKKNSAEDRELYLSLVMGKGTREK